MDNINFLEVENNILIDENENINFLEIENNIINNNDVYETIINLLGLNIKINYPIKNIINGLIEMHMINNNKVNTSRYIKSYVFRNDAISIKIKNILFHQNFIQFSYRMIQHYLLRAYRHYRYNNIMNIKDPKKESKMNVLGFSNDEPRWTPLESLYL
jgi:hypothetical protein